MGFNIAACRKAAGMTQQQVADEMGIKKRTYASWERGEAMVSLEQACGLCEIFGCTINQLSGFEQPADKSQLNNSLVDLTDLDKAEVENVRHYVDFIRSRREPCPQP